MGICDTILSLLYLSYIFLLESSGVDRFDLGPPLQGQTRIAKLKSAYNSLIVGPRGLQCETNLQEIMSCEFSDVVRFELGPPLSRSNEDSQT